MSKELLREALEIAINSLEYDGEMDKVAELTAHLNKLGGRLA